VVNLIGTYECKADAKGRLMMPSQLKKQLNSVLEESFVLKRAVFQPCLELYPMSEWNMLMKKVNKLNRFVKKNNDFIRRFTAGVKMVELVNIVEIWDKDSYEKAIDDATVDFAQLAEDVMGNDNDALDELS
jgi:MraZ protein